MFIHGHYMAITSPSKITAALVASSRRLLFLKDKWENQGAVITVYMNSSHMEKYILRVQH